MAWTGAAGPRRMRHRGRRQSLILTPPRAPSALVVGVLGPAHNRACRRARTNQSRRVQDEFVEMLDPVMGAKSNSNPCPTRPPILCLRERNEKSRSNLPLIRFLRIGEPSSSTSRLLHLGAPLRALIRVEAQRLLLPALARTPLPPGMPPPRRPLPFFLYLRTRSRVS